MGLIYFMKQQIQPKHLQPCIMQGVLAELLLKTSIISLLVRLTSANLGVSWESLSLVPMPANVTTCFRFFSPN